LPSKGSVFGTKELLDAALPVLRKFLKSSRNILFSGDNYSEEWACEAKRRDLPILKKSVDAFEALVSGKTIAAFKGILTEEELNSRHAILAEGYSHTVNIEMKLMIDLFRTQVLPAALKQQQGIASSIQAYAAAMGSTHPINRQTGILQEFSQMLEEAIGICQDLELLRSQAGQIGDVQAQAKSFCKQVMPKGEELRKMVDALEAHVADDLWPLPKYRELLFCM
jgi:glutamine synthetase